MSEPKSAGERRALSLSELLKRPGPILAPGAYDCVSARLIQHAGFGAVFMSGYTASASLLGQPDLGLLTATEMTEHARRLVAAVDIPVIADGDAGFGNALNVHRSVRAYAQVGAAAVQLEDQATPKRCSHMPGKEIIPLEEMLGKIRAFHDARAGADLLLIARTDAVAVHGLAEGIERARALAEAGADLIFVENSGALDEIERIGSALADAAPLVFNWTGGGKTPPLTIEQLTDLGYKLILYPIDTLRAAVAAVRDHLSALRTEPASASDRIGWPQYDDLNILVDLTTYRQMEGRYAP